MKFIILFIFVKSYLLISVTGATLKEHVGPMPDARHGPQELSDHVLQHAEDPNIPELKPAANSFASVRGAFLNTPTGPSRTIFNFRPTSQQTQTPRPYPVQNVNDQNGAQGLPQPTTFFNQGPPTELQRNWMPNGPLMDSARRRVFQMPYNPYF